jgi:hypothetical protein
MKLQRIKPEPPGREQNAKLVAAAKTNQEKAAAQVEKYRLELEKLTGCPITVERGTLDLDADGTLTFVPGPEKSGGKYHIALRSIGAPEETYALARLLVELEIRHQDSVAGKPVVFAPNINCIQSTLPHHKAGLAEQRKSAETFGNALVCLIREMFIESRLSVKIPALRHQQKQSAQFWGYDRAVTENQRTARSRAHSTLCAANALQLDQLLGETKISRYYEPLPCWPRAQAIHGIFQKYFAEDQPGAISQTITEVCAVLGNPEMIQHYSNPVIGLKDKPANNGPELG